MKRIALFVLLSMLGWATVSSGTARGQTANEERLVAGYYAWWMGDAYAEMDLGLYDRILFFTTRVDSSGFILTRNGWPEAWAGLRAATDSVGTRLVPTVAMMEPETILPVFSDSIRWQRLVQDIILMVDEADSPGLHLDVELFEAAPHAAITGFHAFLASLRAALPPDKELSAFAPAFDVSGMYGLEAIAPHIDVFYVQGYDIHWLTGPTAGPVAPLDGWGGRSWKRIVARYRTAEIADERLVMTVPYYGYEWPVAHTGYGAPTTGEGRILTWARVDSLRLPDLRLSVEGRLDKLAVLRDTLSGSPFYTRADSSGVYQGWFEDAESLGKKFDYVVRERLGGIAVFLMGYDNGQFTPLLKAFRQEASPARSPADRSDPDSDSGHRTP